MNRKPIFDAVRSILNRSFSQPEVQIIDRAINLTLGKTADTSRISHRLGVRGKNLIQKWEGCAKRLPDGTFTAYPDPGSLDGHPWTIGWGATGPDIKKGLIWTQAQCDTRFDTDIERYVEEVSAFLKGCPTTANQFDALVSFHYNTGAIRKSTLGRLHRSGDFAATSLEFGKWIYNDGKMMNGLKSRRNEEAQLYKSL